MNDSNARTNPDDSHEYLTTRQRIIDAALREFAEHGFRGASIRGIASAAGVSAGLVQHHFGTKEGLREACDDWVMHLVRDTQYQLLQREAPLMNGGLASRLDEFQPAVDYLIVSLSSGTEASARWFREIIEYTHDTLTSGRVGPAIDPETDDTWAIAATHAAMSLGVTAFYRTMQQVLGIEDSGEMMVRTGRARLVLASERIIGEDMRERVAQMLDQYERSKVAKGSPQEAEGDLSG